MAWSLKTHTVFTGGTGHGGTTSAIDTTGADLLIVNASQYALATSPLGTLSDNKGNTWHGLTIQTNSDTAWNQIFYAWNAAVGIGHTFTFSSANVIFASFEVAAFSGSLTSSDPLDVQNGHVSLDGATTVQPGSITPGANGELVVCGLSVGDSTDAASLYSINSGMTKTDQQLATGSCEGSAFAYLFQTTAAAIDPTWTLDFAPSNDLACTIAAFKAANVVVSGTNSTLPMMGAG